MIECVTNVSEGRRPDVVESIADGIRRVSGVQLLDHSADASHNRSVYTFAGSAPALRHAVLAIFERAIPQIDLRTQRGVHPRIGAVDVVPFIPLDGSTMDEAVALARSVAATVAGRFAVPIYLYEFAATSPTRRHLEDVRRGEFEGLAAKMAQPEWVPDFGPPAPHPTAGASAIGARIALVAYNVNLATSDLTIAARIAATVRQRNGGLPYVKAIGVSLADRGIVQVSMNLTNCEETPIVRAFDAVKSEAAKHGVEVLESELIGLLPRAALKGTSAEHLRLRDFTPDRILENRILRIAKG